jgi:opacity protein-like surface antigen
MKRFVLLMISTCIFGLHAFSQTEEESQNVQFGGGWALCKLEGSDTSYNGFTFNFSYEKFLIDNLSIGGSCNVIRVKTDTKNEGIYKEVPFNFFTKYYIGKSKFKGFVKGAAGCHITRLTIEVNDELSTGTEAGFTAGGGAGLIFAVSEHILLDLDYSLFWLGNSDYANGLVHTVNLNVGYVF